jgi:phospholipid transport system substrate-binding protein
MRRSVAAAWFGVGLVLAAPCRADESGSATDFIRAVGHDMPVVLRNARTIGDKRARLLPFIARIVDVDSVSQYCLGHYWDRATPAQRQEFETLFLAVLVNEIAMFTGGYEAPGVKAGVTMDTPVAQADGTHLPTIVQVGDAPPAHVTWLINMQARPPRILDVTAEGISLRATQRSDFLSFLRRHDGDIGGLLATLRQRAHDTGGLDAAPGHS